MPGPGTLIRALPAVEGSFSKPCCHAAPLPQRPCVPSCRGKDVSFPVCVCPSTSCRNLGACWPVLLSSGPSLPFLGVVLASLAPRHPHFCLSQLSLQQAAPLPFRLLLPGGCEARFSDVLRGRGSVRGTLVQTAELLPSIHCPWGHLQRACPSSPLGSRLASLDVCVLK